jgi:arabinogalactan endo-1,4-beta-galactosidase
MVQIGNEVINGMMWPDGKITANWDNFAELVQAGINGVNAGCDSTEPALAHGRHERENWRVRLCEITKNLFSHSPFLPLSPSFILILKYSNRSC